MQSRRIQHQFNRRRSWLIGLAACSSAGVLALACLICGVAIMTFIAINPLETTSEVSSSLWQVAPHPQQSTDSPRLTLHGADIAGTPLPSPSPTAPPTITPTPLGSTPVAVAPAKGWAFEGVRVQPDPSLGGLLVYGEAINSAGSPQRILGLQGTYFDASGQPITPKDISDYWPIETVLNGERMPFELTLIGPTTIERVDLQVVTESSSELPRTDFELSNIEGSEQEADYCVTGHVRNVGQPLTEYLMVVAVLYDDDDRVINWGIGYEPAANVPVGDKTVVVSACAERFNRIVARYELRAWGQ